MARSQHSRSPSPMSPRMSPPSPSFSDTSADDNTSIPSEQPDAFGPSASRPGSPSPRETIQIDAVESDDSVTCLWDDCGLVYTHLPTLIQHIHTDHIGVHKSNYTCEWSTCQRRGLAQTSRFALISHIRSHTGEKPFTCTLPECDKSFTRSDALAKHLRLQHNISPPAPGRGGYRKRKRGTESAQPSSSRAHSPPPPPASNSNGTFGTFKVEPSPYPDGTPMNGHRSPSPPYPPPRRHARSPANDDGYAAAAGDTLPVHLLQHYVPETNLVLGRSPSMVMYLLMKAKHRYALEQHESLIEELRVTKAELKKEKEDKERALDALLAGLFGPQAEPLLGHIPPPPGMSMASSHSSASISSGIVHTNGNGR